MSVKPLVSPVTRLVAALAKATKAQLNRRALSALPRLMRRSRIARQLTFCPRQKPFTIRVAVAAGVAGACVRRRRGAGDSPNATAPSFERARRRARGGLAPRRVLGDAHDRAGRGVLRRCRRRRSCRSRRGSWPGLEATGGRPRDRAVGRPLSPFPRYQPESRLARGGGVLRGGRERSDEPKQKQKDSWGSRFLGSAWGPYRARGTRVRSPRPAVRAEGRSSPGEARIELRAGIGLDDPQIAASRRTEGGRTAR
jgi:hypothetical protein